MKLVVNSSRTLLEALGAVKRAFEKDKYVNVTITTRKRSLDSNALMHVWFDEISNQGDDTALYYKSLAKYMFGMSILSSSDPEYVAIIIKSFGQLTHEERIKAMMHVDVTSRFDREQMKMFMEQVKFYYESQGFVLSEGR
jgi:hypothetical protein